MRGWLIELWVRSQNKKRLMKVEMVEIDKQKDGGAIIYSHEYILGEYKTKERAMEVLDEIQKILKPKYIIDTSSIKPDGDFYEENGIIMQKYNANARIEEITNNVYEMPKE